MLKLIFCKTYEEQEGGDELDFSIDPIEQKSESGQRRLLEDRLAPMFDKVKTSYPHIFKSDEQLTLPPMVAAYVVSELQFISILNSTTDVKGEAYETLVGANLRGDRGEYFTPRNVCDMTVQVIMAMHAEHQLTTLRVVDCCCGTGGFLVSWLSNLRKHITAQEERRGTSDIGARVRERVKSACSQNLFGLDINPSLVRTAQMNLVMHGDGSTNVYRANSAARPGEWPDDTRLNVPFGAFDVVVTNPPFGSEVTIDDAHILSQYELPRWNVARERSSMPAEQLFIEAALNFLKPGGILGVVIPDGILTNPGLLFLRDWITKRARIVASIALPKETFGRNGGVNNPSVLILRKFTDDELKNALDLNVVDTSHRVFLCAPATAGIDKRGSAVYLRHATGEFLLDESGQRIPDDQISRVGEVFAQWWRQNIV
ncbi:MAG: N-6 DNA methylase [Chloroflexi bacterium]|nr:N-6 DNA methylase [Chloroflexota bacterium]